MQIDAKGKIHNRFDIEVKDIRTGEITQIGQAENIVLNGLYPALGNSGTNHFARNIAYGSGTGTLSPNRTTLFARISHSAATIVESVINELGASYCKKKIVIPAGSQVGKTITEVGFGTTTVFTHALVKDSEGNFLPIGPLTDFDEVTIYGTIFVELVLPEGFYLLYNAAGKNAIVGFLTGDDLDFNWASWKKIGLTDVKKPTSHQTKFLDRQVYFADFPSTLGEKYITTGRIRMAGGEGNGKIWAATFIDNTSTRTMFAIEFPNEYYPGHHFEGKSIGVGDGTKTKFILPWSEINTTKEYKFYVDGALKIKDVDYILANSTSETSITFVTPPANELGVTGDWWVDYVPKDATKIFDITINFLLGEGA